MNLNPAWQDGGWDPASPEPGGIGWRVASLMRISGGARKAAVAGFSRIHRNDHRNNHRVK